MNLDQKVQSLLDEATSDSKYRIPGAVFVAIDRTGTQIAARSSGVRGLKEKVPMTLDTIFYIASCTKLVTAIAALQLVEQGKLNLDEPEQVKKYLPELSQTRVLNSSGKPGEVRKNYVTLRMLLSHTAGYGYHFSSTALRDSDTPMPRTIEHHLADPILFEPGTSWEYGISLDIVGILIERVTSTTLEEYFQENILKPLNIKDFSFYVPNNKLSRLAVIHNRGSDDSLDEGLHLTPVVAEGDGEFMHAGGSGGFTTMVEYSKILAALLCGGVSPTTKQRILGSDTVKLMVENQIPDIPDFARKGFEDAVPFITNPVQELYPQPGNPPQGWSMGGMLTLEADSRTGRKKNTIHWCGITNLYWWLDIESGVAGILGTQILPFFDNRVLILRDQLEKTVYNHIV
ncbi:beta-lactamase/transpeptidase-like protein [Tothia fuscella]|uniref:Beta-lactamase/transpeptidase-like protein n=1 Tax=Tothia fuscella TaxID=1048955 RepID=A0A9P4TZE2_9PEZI|nr:beta-lactamase/transpeptidase-like protein [Tothia fuscella]